MPEKTALIIGAGVIGLSTAYHLARRNYGRIIVLDKGLAGDGSSSRAGGIITGLMWSEPSVRARTKALQLYRDLSHELDGYRFQDVGCLNLFDPVSWPERSAFLPIYDRCQAPYEILSAAELRIPFKAFVHQRCVTRPLARLLLGASTREREEFRVPALDWHMSAVPPLTGVKERLLSDFRPFVPALADASRETEKVGLLTFSLDGDPILGPVAKMPGLYLAMAFHSGGFAYNPVAGFLTAEYVAEGKTSIDVREFSPNRFDGKVPDSYFTTTLRQKDVVMRRH